MTVAARYGELVSGEGVRLELVRAGVASRTIAAVVDIAIQALAAALLLGITFAAGGTDAAALAALTVAELVLVVAGYPIVLEWTTRGRTVGKICLGLRVVRDDGGPIGFRQALVRGLTSLILEKPGVLFPVGTAAGIITLTVSREQKRIGDYLAGTVVLDERAAPQPLATPWPQVPYPLAGWARALDLQRVDDALALRIRQFVSRAYAMSPAGQADLGRRLYEQVSAVISPPPPPGAPVADVLGTILTERRNRGLHGSAVPPRPGPAAPTREDTPGHRPPNDRGGFVAPS